jgi:hypothetical protein
MLLLTAENANVELVANVGSPVALALELEPQPGNIGSANIEARPTPPRKMERRVGFSKARLSTSWKCSLFESFVIGSSSWDMVSSKLSRVESLNVHRPCEIFITALGGKK